MRWLVFSVLGVAPLLGLSNGAIAQVSPPPSSPAVMNVSAMVAAALESNNLTAYQENLADSLQVTIDGKTVASSKQDWVRQFGTKLSTNGVAYKVQRAFGGSTDFIHVIYFNSQGSYPPPRQECCQYYEVAKYSIRGGKITAIQILRTGKDDFNR